MNERETLYRRLSAAVSGHCAGFGEPPPPDAPDDPPGDPAARFAETFPAAGGVLFRGPVESFLSDLAETLRKEGVSALFFPEDDARARRTAEALVPFGPFTLVTGTEVWMGSTAVTAGFRTAEAGIAETGTIVETSSGGKTLLPGLLADVHVSILPESRVLPRMDDALSPFAENPPRNVSFLSGPSKTADIEQTLTTGAHGPKRAIALLLQSPPEGAHEE